MRTLVLLAGLLLLMPSVLAHEAPAAFTPNVLDVDASTSSTTYTDNDAPLTTIQVRGLEPAQLYLLYDPWLAPTGLALSSGNGVANFDGEILLEGTYTLLGPDGFTLQFAALPDGCALDAEAICAAGVMAPKAPTKDVKQPGVKSPTIDQPSSPKKPAPTVAKVTYDAPEPDDTPRLPGPPRVPTITLPCDTAPECQTLVCQATPGNCNVPMPTIGPCPSGKTGRTINGAQTTCVNDPTPPCDTAPECQTLVCQATPGNCNVPLPTIAACGGDRLGYTVNGIQATCIDEPTLPCDTVEECKDVVCGQRRYLLDEDCQLTLCPGAATECADVVCQSVGWTDESGNCEVPPLPCTTSDCLDAPGCLLVDSCAELVPLLQGGDLFAGVCADPDAQDFYDQAAAPSPHSISEQCEDDSWHANEPNGPLLVVPGIPGGPSVPDPTSPTSTSPFTLNVQQIIGAIPGATTRTTGNGNYHAGECPVSVYRPHDLDGDGIDNNADPDMDCDGLMDVVEENILGTSSSSPNSDGIGAWDGFDLAPMDTTIHVGVRITEFEVDGGLDPWSYYHDGADPYIDQLYIAAFPGNPVYLPNIPHLNHEDHPHDVGNRNDGDVVQFNPDAAFSSADVPGIDDIRQWLTVGGRPQLTIHLAAFDHDGDSRGKDDPIDLSLADSGHAANLVMDLANLADAVSNLQAFTFDGELDGDGASNDGSIRVELRVEVSGCQLKASTAVLNDPTALVSESLLNGCRQ